MQEYLDWMRKIHNDGDIREEERTGTNTRAIFGLQMEFDLAKGFPLLTTKKLHLKSIIYELLWFLRGDTNVAYLNEHGVSIWNEWADENGELGPVYGSQWRSWPDYDGRAIDQISGVINRLMNDPQDRRMIVSAWNVGLLAKMKLPPCPIFFQFYVADSKLSCKLYQRSADWFLGVPFNIASYSLLIMMVAQVCKLKPGRFIHTFGDAHLYSNHRKQARLQLERAPFKLPTMKLNPKVTSIDDFEYKDFELQNYEAHPNIAAKVSV